MPKHAKVNVAVQTRAALLKNRTIRCLYKTQLQSESRWSAVVIAWAQGLAEKFGHALMAEITATRQGTDRGEGPQQRRQHRALEDGREGHGEKRHEECREEGRGKETAELEQPKQQQPTEELNNDQSPTDKKKDTAGFIVQMNLVSLSRRNVFLCFDLFLEDCTSATRRRVDQSLEEPIHFVFRKDGAYYVQLKRNLDSTVSTKYRYARSKDKGSLPLYSDLDNPPLYDNGRRVPDEERHKYGMSTFFETAGRP